jgi:hypothetical protein
MGGGGDEPITQVRKFQRRTGTDLNKYNRINADPYPGSQTHADLDPGQTLASQKVGF